MSVEKPSSVISVDRLYTGTVNLLTSLSYFILSEEIIIIIIIIGLIADIVVYETVIASAHSPSGAQKSKKGHPLFSESN